MAFFWMKLGRKNVIACNTGGKGTRVVGLPGHQRGIMRFRVVAVHKIESLAAEYAGPQWVRSCLTYLVPAHVRHLQALTCNSIGDTRKIEMHYLARQHGWLKKPAN